MSEDIERPWIIKLGLWLGAGTLLACSGVGRRVRQRVVLGVRVHLNEYFSHSICFGVGINCLFYNCCNFKTSQRGSEYTYAGCSPINIAAHQVTLPFPPPFEGLGSNFANPCLLLMQVVRISNRARWLPSVFRRWKYTHIGQSASFAESSLSNQSSKIPYSIL